MKKILNISLIALFSLLIVSCENQDDPRFQDNPDTGWIEFTRSSVTTGVADESITFNFNLTARISEPFTVTYDIVAVESDFSMHVPVSSGTVTIAPDDSTIYSETIPLVNTDGFRDYETIFDVVLTGSSNSNIALGLVGDNNSQRFTIPCSEPSTVDDLLATYPDYMTGEYDLTDGTVNGLDGLAGIVRYFHTLDADDNIVPQRVTLLQGATPAERTFDAIVFNGLGFARVRTFVLEIVTDPVIGNTVIFKNMIDPAGVFPDTSTGLGCGIPILIEPIPAADAEEVNYTEWFTCNGGPAFEINYVENRLGSCGQDEQFSTFILTRPTTP